MPLNFELHTLVSGVPSAYQQKRIKELNSTLQREQLESLEVKDRMIMVSVVLPRLEFDRPFEMSPKKDCW